MNSVVSVSERAKPVKQKTESRIDKENTQADDDYGNDDHNRLLYGIIERGPRDLLEFTFVIAEELLDLFAEGNLCFFVCHLK